MVAYTVYANKVKIGEIYMNDQGSYKYIPIKEGIDKSSVPQKIFGTPQSEWGKMPRIFEQRISANPNCVGLCNCATDTIEIEKNT